MKENSILVKKVTYPGVKLDRYTITSDGRVFSITSNKYMTPQIDRDGYVTISLIGYSTARVHRLVAWEFYPETRNIELTVDHKDGNKQNNDYTNLEWVTSAENTRRAIEMGLRNTNGENNGNNKYSEQFIHDICALFESGKSAMDVYRLVRNTDRLNKKESSNEDFAFYQMLYRIHERKLWTEVSSQYSWGKVKAKKIYKPVETSRCSEEEIHKICKMHVDGVPLKDIIKSLGIDESNEDYKRYYNAASSIIAGRNWAHISSQYFIPENKSVNHYNIDNEQLFDWIDQGRSKDFILKQYGITCKNDNPLLYRAIHRRVTNYLNTMKNNKLS